MWAIIVITTIISAPYVPSASGVVVLSEEVLDAAASVINEVAKLPEWTPMEAWGHSSPLTLVSACVVSGATTPSYKLHFREWHAPICVHRPWRVYSWFVDLASTCECEKESEIEPAEHDGQKKKNEGGSI